MINLSNYPNEQLWAVIYDRLLPSQSERLHDLCEKNKWVKLSIEEEAELDQLMTLVNYQTLRRSEALLLLKQRGEDITIYLNSKIE